MKWGKITLIKHLQYSNKPDILMIGPYPPPYGGIANVVKNLSSEKTLCKNFNIEIFRTGKTKESTQFPIQAIMDILQMMKYFLTIKNKEVQIIHIHTASYWSFLRNVPYVIISRYRTKKRIIVHIHGGEFKVFFEKASDPMKKIIRKTLTSVDCIFVTAPSWIDIIGKIIGDDENIYSIPNGYDETKFFLTSHEKARNNLHLPKNKKIILAVGSLEHHKGHHFLIESLSESTYSINNVISYIIGEGSLSKNLSQLIKNHNMTDKIVLVGGNKTPEEIALWMNAADIFVLPSLTEGNPTVMFECLACGKPFVGTSVGGIPDIINSPEYGLLCKPGDVKDLTEKIQIALKKEWNHEKIIKYAEDFTWANIALKINKVYEKMINDNRKRQT